MDILAAFGLSASAGLNAYIPLLVVSLLARFTDLITLSEPWNAMESWWIIGLLIVLSLIEFFVDKVPAVNHINDIASANVITDAHPVLSLAAGLLIAGSVHAVKSVAVRPAVTATTGGTANVPVSVLEDVVSTVLSLLSVVLPIVVGVVLLILAIWIIWWLTKRSNRAQT